MKRQGLIFKDSDLLNLHVIICMVDNQPEINGSRTQNNGFVYRSFSGPPYIKFAKINFLYLSNGEANDSL